MLIAGYDIGGTKCAALLGKIEDGKADVLCRDQIETKGSWQSVLDKLTDLTYGQTHKAGLKISDIESIGVSCGGPLCGKKGLILSPPNLTGWDNVPVCAYIESKTSLKVRLKNDADACALAEYRFGGGKSCENMIFLTFGTGLGAGLILNGKLYEGATNFAGEVGHVRLSDEGPVGYGKRGSFEGFCSGSGISRQIETYYNELRQQGVAGAEKLCGISAKQLAALAERGDPDALKIFDGVGEKLGKGLAILIDILNPELIIIGGVFMRSHKFLRQSMVRVLNTECLSSALAAVKIIPSVLGESIGDYGAIVAAME